MVGVLLSARLVVCFLCTPLLLGNRTCIAQTTVPKAERTHHAAAAATLQHSDSALRADKRIFARIIRGQQRPVMCSMDQRPNTSQRASNNTLLLLHECLQCV